MSSISPGDVLAFWFEPRPTTEGELMASVRRWFMGGPAMDAEVTERFGSAVEGGLEDWMERAEGRLALILLLDQLTRNVYRDQPRMYAGDARAQQIALASFARFPHRNALKAWMFVMRLMHSGRDFPR